MGSYSGPTHTKTKHVKLVEWWFRKNWFTKLLACFRNFWPVFENLCIYLLRFNYFLKFHLVSSRGRTTVARPTRTTYQSEIPSISMQLKKSMKRSGLNLEVNDARCIFRILCLHTHSHILGTRKEISFLVTHVFRPKTEAYLLRLLVKLVSFPVP